MDREAEVSKIFIISIECLMGLGTISIHEERLQISEAGRNDQILRCLENVNHNGYCFVSCSIWIELDAFVAYLAGASFNTDRHTG